MSINNDILIDRTFVHNLSKAKVRVTDTKGAHWIILHILGSSILDYVKIGDFKEKYTEYINETSIPEEKSKKFQKHYNFSELY